MSPKHIIIVGTMVFVITIGGLTKSPEARGSASILQSETELSLNTTEDDFLQALGASSDEEVYEALYNGKSLADVADEHHKDVKNIIRLQVAELTEQLNARLAAGSLTPEVYQAQKSELEDIVTKSAYGIKYT